MKIILNRNPMEYEPEEIISCLMQLDFLNKYKYEYYLPDNEVINGLKGKEIDYSYIDLIKSSLTDEDSYKEIYDNVVEDVNRVNNILKKHEDIFLKYEKLWGFKIFDEYELEMTKYGTGGSYNHFDGIIITNANVEKAKDEIILHELIHIGIEESIIRKNYIKHPTKEYIVDKFMKDHFSEEFPDYKIQKIDDDEIDNNIKSELDNNFNWDNLGELFNNKIKS